MAGHYPGILTTGHIGTNTPKFVPPRWGRLPFDPTQTGLCKFGCGFGARWKEKGGFLRREVVRSWEAGEGSSEGLFIKNSRRLWLSEIPCWKGFPASFDAAGKWYSPIFRQREILSLPRFGHFPARKTAAGKLAAGTLLDFLLRDRHRLLEFFWVYHWGRNYYILNSEKIKSCKNTGLHYSN